MKPLLLRLIRSFGRFWCRVQGAEVDPKALIHGLPRISRKLGARIILESGTTLNTTLWSNPLNDGRQTVLHAGPGSLIHFKKDSGVSSSRIIAFREITIGEGTLIGAGCLICDSDMHEVPLGSDHPVKAAPIHIGDHVFIGANCTILKGVTIGDGAVIGAASVVRQDIPPGGIAVGNPAQIIRNL
jgi:carbonic anhydrase/acetyltransferase-like protein (isoleucine patch superfamily)